MERLSINFKDNAFGPDIADDCTLRAIIGPDGLSLSVRRKSGKGQLLYTWAFPQQQRENALRRILHKEDVLTYPFERLELAYCTPVATIVPKRMFDPELTGEYLNTLTETMDGMPDYEPLNGMDMVAVWANEIKLEAIGAHFFPKARKLPYAAGLVESMKKYSSASDTAVCVHIRPSLVQVAAFESGNLLFFNTFQYEKSADVLYFTLLAYDQFHFKPTSVPLYLSGEILKESEIYRQFERFVAHIHFLPAKSFSGFPEVLSPHLYLDQTLFL
jgi:hypothetical protein